MPAHFVAGTVVREADVLLADGGVVHLRPVEPGDEALIRAMISRLSDETLRLRYFGSVRRQVESDLAKIVAPDQRHRVVLLAVLGGDVLGMGYFTRWPEDPSAGEVAFLIEDAHQRRGIGSIILEHLAEAARESGLTRFTAEVLPDNMTMISVFREVGFEVRARTEDGVVLVTLDIAPTSRSLEVMRAREHTAEARSVARLLAPRRVAVIGASRRPGTLGHEIFRHLLASPFQGPVYPVNTSAAHVAGVRAYPSIGDVPDEVDVAFVVVPAANLPDLIPACAERGVHALVIISTFIGSPEGFRESVVGLARAHGMRVVGPECMGVLNTAKNVRLNGSLVPSLPRSGRVGFFSQSGSLGIDVLARALDRGIGVSTLVSAGERADVSGNSLLQYWLDDGDTDVVLLYLETFGNPDKFARLAKAVSRRKPVVAVQAVAPENRVRALAMFSQAGIIRVDSLGELLDVASLLSHGKLPRGNRVAIIDNITSLGRIAEAACPIHGLEVAHGKAVHLGARATIDELLPAVREALADDEVDAVVTAFVKPLVDPGEARRSIERLAANSSKPVLLTTPQQLEARLPTYASPEEAIRALAHAVRYVAWRALPVGEVPFFDNIDVSGASGIIDQLVATGTVGVTSAARGLLAAYGLEYDDAGAGAGTDVSVSVTNDPDFGRSISLGIAGISTDLFGDISWRALPMTDLDGRRMIDDLRSVDLLRGLEGRPVVDLEAVVEVLMRIARIGTDHGRLSELHLTVRCRADGAVVRALRGSLGSGSLVDDAGPRRLG